MQEELSPYETPRISRIDTRTPITEGIYNKLCNLIGRPILRGKELQESEYPTAIVSWMNAMRAEYYSAYQTSQFSPKSVAEIGYELADNNERKGEWYRVEYDMDFSNENCRGSRPEAMELLIDASGTIIRTIEYHHNDLKRSSTEYVWKEEGMELITLSEHQKKLVIEKIASLAVPAKNPEEVHIDTIEATYVTTHYCKVASSEPTLECSIRIQGTLRQPVKMKYTGSDWTYDTKKFEGVIYLTSNAVQLKFYMLKDEKE